MASPPPTPSGQAPTRRSEWNISPGSVANFLEPLVDYDKFNPVDLGDRFKDGRYRVLRKLGAGSSSMVWLVKDEQTGCFVALKMLTADSTAAETESSMLKKITQNALPHPGKEHIMYLKDYFKHNGPKGEHGCLVFEAMGPSATSMLECLQPPEKRKKPEELDKYEPDRYPVWMARSVVCQTLLAIDFLHCIGIVHADMQPGNLLFSTRNLESVEETRLLQKPDDLFTSTSYKKEGDDFKMGATKYILKSKPLAEFVELYPEFDIKISDMCGAFFADNPPKKLDASPSLRSPEAIVEEPPTSGLDIWHIGCLLFEFVTGSRLFCVTAFLSTRDEVDDEHLLLLHDIIGPLPRDILAKWPRSDIYFNSDGENIRNFVGKIPEGSDPMEAPCTPRLEEFFDQEKPPDVSEEDANDIKRILRWILQYDASKRPSAAEILNDPWFSEEATAK